MKSKKTAAVRKLTRLKMVGTSHRTIERGLWWDPQFRTDRKMCACPLFIMLEELKELNFIPRFYGNLQTSGCI